jgi:hypothetical protein
MRFNFKDPTKDEMKYRPLTDEEASAIYKGCYCAGIIILGLTLIFIGLWS